MMDSKQKAEELVNGIRQSDYGHPKVNMKRIASIWSGVLDMEVTPEQVALCMAGLKLARLVHSPNHEDTQVDLMGYIAVLQRLLDPDDQPVSGLYKPEDLKKAMQDTIGAYAGFQETIGTPGKGIRLIDPRGKVFWCETATAASILVGNGWTQADPDEPTAFTAEPYSWTDEPAGVYPDGSKDMTFEEAVGEAGPPKFYGSGRNPCGQ